MLKGAEMEGAVLTFFIAHMTKISACEPPVVTTLRPE